MKRVLFSMVLLLAAGFTFAPEKKVKEDKKRMSYFEKQEWATIEDEIAYLEAKIEEIEAAMLENASDYGQLATLQRDLDAANETLLEKYERYEYLSELEG